MTFKRFSTILISAMALLAGAISAAAQNADDILGEYYSKQGADEYKARISKNADGNLSIRGSLMGIGETVIWKRL